MFKVFATASLAAVLVMGAAAPALALNCMTGTSGVHMSLGITFGEKMTEREKANFLMMELRQRGVDATRVEFWGTCVRAFVRQPGGRETMEFYNPETLERVQ